MSPTLSPVAHDVKRELRRHGRSATEIATALGRTGKGLGPVLKTLERHGAAVRNEDGTYSKP